MLLLLTLTLYDGGQVAHYKGVANVDKGSCPPVPLVHHITVLEMVHERYSALNTRICQRTDLLAVEHLPALSVEFLVEVMNEFGVEEIDESISHVA